MLVIAMVASSCSKDEPQPDPVPTRTVIVYMAANCNLGTMGYDRLDLEEMRTAAPSIPEGSHLVVYHAGRNKAPELKEITAAADVSHKVYDGGYRNGLTLTPERMRGVFADGKALAPAVSYGLVFWSHGTGWVETSESRSSAPSVSDGMSRSGSEEMFTVPDQQISTFSFGNDYGTEMKITSLAEALSGQRFDFIYFDCCLMGSVEVAYELRNVTPTIVASPTELQIFGMRYDLNIPEFFKPEPDMKEAARNTFNYYAQGIDGRDPSCSMVVIETEHLPALAAATRDIMATGAMPDAGYRPARFYGYYRNSFVDMTDYITSLPGVSPSLISAWREAYNKAVVYKAATPTYFDYDLSRFGGLTCAMLTAPGDESYMGYYNQAWYKDVVSKNPSLAPAGN